jgi:hypothetical protein
MRYRGFAAALMLATALAGATVGLVGNALWLRVTVVSLAIAACALGVSVLSGSHPRRFLLLAMVASGVLGFFCWHLSQSPSPFPLRGLDEAVLLAYGAVLLAAALWILRVGDETRVLLLSFSIAVPLFVADTLLARAGRWDEPRWQVSALRDPPLGFRYHPNTTAATYYPDNPRGYFSANDSPRDSWALEIGEDSEGRLEHGGSEPGRMRVTLNKTSRTEPWRVRLVQAPFEIERWKRYAVRFRARADAPRPIGCTMDRTRTPWAIAPYLTLKIRPDWRSYECPFVATESESHARIVFDLAFSDVPVEFANVALHDLSAGRDLAPRRRFFVSYRFNALGFRGPDYAIPAPEGTFRILALGDSFTMGVGVHERDTFAAQLERRLNKAAASGDGAMRYEVINAGVGGYSTEQERLSYELLSSSYLPQLVLLTMVFNDDLAFEDEVKRGFVPELAEPAVSTLWSKLNELRQPERTYDYSGSVRELLRLHESCRQRGARLAVAIFRQSSWEPWMRLVQQVTEGVRGTDIPVLDLGPTLLAVPESEELDVHATDGHPNEIAHRLAAEELERFLRAEGLLPSGGSLQPDLAMRGAH